MSDSILTGLDDRQREAAVALRGPVVVRAGAGTGKTRVITRRIAHGVHTGAYTPGRVMAVTFTAKAAGEMRSRLRVLGAGGVAARTFHAAALSQVNYFWPTLSGGAAPRVLDHKVRALAHAADGLGLRPTVATLRDIAAEIEWRKVTLRSIEDYAVARPDGASGLGLDAVIALQRAYEALKDERHQMDFEDVLLACAGMLEAEPRVARAVHEQYRHFTVDEFQDVSPLQHRLLLQWLGDRRDLCVVGDASQAIYSFAGADPRFLLDFGRDFADAVQVSLETSYRSVEPILGAANALMRGRPGAVNLRVAVQRAAPPPTVTSYADDAAEARGVAARVRAAIDAGASPSSIAVLYRAHAQSAEVSAALADAGVATIVLGGARFFDMPEVREAVMALRAAAVAPGPADLVDSVRDVLRSLGLTSDPPVAGGAARGAWEARAALLRLAEQAAPETTLRAFADDLSARAQVHDEPEVAAVTLATVHAAKGLEWDHVHLIGVAEGLLPISYATTLATVDEERRLAYVGITRAAETLSLSWAVGARRRSPSRFLAEIGNSIRDGAGAPGRRPSPPRRGGSASG